MTRPTALWTAFLGSYEVTFIRAHAVLLTVCIAAIALAVICVAGAQ